jgi:glycosyltransferase involved in cell wall biosynthesis
VLPVNVLAWPGFENKTGNPYTRLLYAAVEDQGVVVDDFTLRRALTGGYDLWHLHWPDDFLSYPATGTAVVYVLAELILMALARMRGTKILWTIHDLGPHESRHPWLERLFWPLFLAMIGGYVTLSEHARGAALDQFPQLHNVPGAVVRHGHYRTAYPERTPMLQARETLGLPSEDPVLAYFGRIRPYKNVQSLLEAFRAIDDTAAHLYVAGNPFSSALAEQIQHAAGTSSRIHLDLRFFPEQEVPDVFGAADLIVLPYEDILHSGTALLSLSFDRPVLVPDRGAMSELQKRVGSEWVRTFQGDLTPQILTDCIEWVLHRNRANRAPLGNLSWTQISSETISFYQQVLDV